MILCEYLCHHSFVYLSAFTAKDGCQIGSLIITGHKVW